MFLRNFVSLYKAPFPQTRIFVRSITILEFLKIAVCRGNLRAKFQGHSSATSCEEGNKTLARQHHDVVRLLCGITTALPRMTWVQLRYHYDWSRRTTNKEEGTTTTIRLHYDVPRRQYEVFVIYAMRTISIP